MHEPIIWFSGFDVGGASINHDNYTNHSCLLIAVLSGRMIIDRQLVCSRLLNLVSEGRGPTAARQGPICENMSEEGSVIER